MNGGAYQNKDGKTGAGKAYEGGWKHIKDEFEIPKGRWPAGLILQHTPDCKIIGYRNDNYQINRFDNGAKPWGDAVGEEFTEHKIEGKTPVYECVEGCPVQALDEQSGNSQSNYCPNPSEAPNRNTWGGTFQTNRGPRGYADSGGASRFFYQATYNLEQSDPFYYCAKASKSEKNEGLDEFDEKIYAQSGGAPARLKDGDTEYLQNSIGMNRIRKVKNNHPTIKPIDLTCYLAGLILPPKEYAPRRILIPFAGTGSEMIGAFQSGWDEIIGVELEEEYVEIGNARIEYWTNKDRQLSFL